MINKSIIGLNPKSDLLGLIRGYTPFLAVIITFVAFNQTGSIFSHFRKALQFRASPSDYLIAVFAPLIFNILVFVLVWVFHPETIAFESLNPLRFVLIYVVFIFLDGPLGEELGWRGFLLPELLKKWNPVVASLFIGLVWFLWHIPLYAADGKDLTSMFLIKYFVTIQAHSVFFTFLFLKRSKNVLLAVLLHTSINYFIFLRNSLVPGMREIQLDNNGYMIVVVITALIPLFILMKNNDNIELETDSQ